MEGKWLNLFVRYSGFTYRLKQKVVGAGSFFGALPYALVLVFSELGFAIVSLPLYIIVSPKKLQETGLVFPEKAEERTPMRVYLVRRRISLGTVWGVVGVWALKILVLGIASMSLFSAEKLLAFTQNWDFSVPTDYTYDNSKIAVAGGVAQLVDQGTGGSCSGTASACTTFVATSTCQAQSGCAWGGAVSGSTTNPGFDTATLPWTYVDWENAGKASGARVATGGNPGAFVNITLAAANNSSISGYWYQSITTTANNPTATLNFDWKITGFSSTGNISYIIYAFVDTNSGVPVVGNEVWSQIVTSTTGWVNVSNLNVSSKVTAAGTYYLKIAARRVTGAGAGGNDISGFDNISLIWNKPASCSGTAATCSSFLTFSACSVQGGCTWNTVPVYPTSSPAITANVSLAPAGVTGWNSFTETATKGTGEIYYQLSDDDGVTWKYWSGTTWATSTTSTNYNTATVVNANINNFSIASGKIRWKAFLWSNGSGQVVLDNVAIGYTQNNPPAISGLSPVQSLTNGYVYVSYNLSDAQSDPSSLVNYEYSTDGSVWSTMTAVSGDPAHSGVSGLTTSPSGNPHTFVWNALADLGSGYFPVVYVRLRANDGIANGNFTTSTTFSVDHAAPVVTNVTAAQLPSSSDVSIGYDLSDNSVNPITVQLTVSSDGGSTWTVATSSATGDVGNLVSSGNGKSIIWHSGTDFPDQENNTMMVAISAKDKYQNQGAYVNSGTFALDNKAPVIATTTDMLAQPYAGATTVLVGGSFTESNPSTTEFSVALNGGAYGSPVTGDSHTASPANKYVQLSAPLKGNDYISAVKIVLTDTFGHSTNNENASPNIGYKYVKPYAPAAPTINNPGPDSLDVTINKNTSEVDGLEYTIFENSTSQYVQSDGTLGASPYWQQATTTRVTGLSTPITQYTFQVKSRNTSDLSHAITSESDLSSGASSNYVSPQITINSASETTNGTRYVNINYTGIDNQNANNNLNVYEYSTDGTTWQTMTEKIGVGDGKTNLAFTAAGRSFVFAWDVATDLPNVEDSAVYVRIQSNDSVTNSNLAESGAFAVDTNGPRVSNISVGQVSGTNNVSINYDLDDGAGSGNLVRLFISDDGGLTYSVATTSVTGDVGANVTAGSFRNIVWNAGTDMPNAENATMKVKINCVDSYGNAGSDSVSNDFNLDTKAPVISSVAASQISGSGEVAVSYTLADQSTSTVQFEISSDSGATWNIATTTFTGDMGSGITAGTKTFNWNGATDFPDQESNTMQVHVKATDIYGHAGSYVSSADFSINTKILSISNITAVQTVGTKNVVIHYDINKNATTTLQISPDGGSTWGVAASSITGDLGYVTAGFNKTISWNPGVDFTNEELATMRIRMRGVDELGNTSAYYESANFIVDTAAPLALSNLRKYAGSASSITMNWTAAIDSHFARYELWHGANETDVNNRTSTATKWSVADDANLNNISTISTVITGLNISNNYFVKIWAMDDYGNEFTIPFVNVYTPVTTTPQIPTPPSVGDTTQIIGGGEPVLVKAEPPAKPILTQLLSPTQNNKVSVVGLSTPGMHIDLYDTGSFVKRLSNAVGTNGTFSETVNFTIGEHSLSVKAVDASGTFSEMSDPVYLSILEPISTAPIILSPRDGESITSGLPKIVGISSPRAGIELVLDGRSTFPVTADVNGSWEITIPSSFALVNGSHRFEAYATVSGMVRSPAARINVIKTAARINVVTSTLQNQAAVSVPVPPPSVIRETVSAVVSPAIASPEVTNVEVASANDTISFSGKALPNQDVIIYLHSAQALIYRTKADANGKWTITHSQAETELAPGEHTVYAVALDPSAKVKSSPSSVSTFTVTRNFWVMVFKYLNLKTTLVTLIMLSSVVFWFYRLRKRGIQI